jgi:thimet oligopeptidase
MSEVHPDRPLREAAEASVQEISAYATELSLHRGLYDALASVPLESLTPETRRFLEHTLRDFRRSGVDKDEPTRARLKELADRAVRLGQDFDRAIREDVRGISLRPEQLAGLPEDYCAAHRPGPDGKVRITTTIRTCFRSGPTPTTARRGASCIWRTPRALTRGTRRCSGRSSRCGPSRRGSSGRRPGRTT